MGYRERVAWYARFRPRGASRPRSRGATSKVLHGLANALLSLGVPRVREWLQGRFGPRADVREIAVDGPLLRVAHATLPLGPRMRLEVRTATFEILRGALAGRPEVALASLEGALVAGDAAARFEAPVSFRRDREGERGADWVSGTLVVRGATWTSTQGTVAGAGQTPLDGEVIVRVGETDWSIRRGAFQAGRASIRLAASGDLEGDTVLRHASLEIDGARAGHFVDAVAALTGRALAPRIPLPPDLVLWGTLAHDTRSSQVSLRLDTARSSADLGARVTASGDVEVASLGGTLAVADLPPAWLAEMARAVDLGDAVVRVEARAHGDVARPVVEATFVAPSVSVRAPGQKRFLPPLRLHELRGSLHAGASGADLRATANLEGGGRATIAARLSPGSLEDHDVTICVVDLSPPWAVLLARALGRALPAALPADTRATVDAHLTATTWTGVLDARTPRSDITLAWRGSRARVEGDLGGSLSFADARALGLFTGPILPRGDGLMSTEGMHLAVDPGGVATLEGTVRAGLVHLDGEGDPAPTLVLSDAAARVRIDGEGLVIEDGHASCHGGRVSVRGRVPFDGAPPGTSLVHVQFARIGAGVLAPLLARPDLGLPPDLALEGEIDVQGGDRLRAEIAVSSPRGTDVLVDLALHREGQISRLDGSTARGRIRAEDALATGLLHEVTPAHGDEVTFEASLAGPMDAVVFRGRATAAHVRLEMASRPEWPGLRLEDVGVHFRVDRARLVWHHLRARVAKGVLASSGLASLAGDGTLTVALMCAGVDLASLPARRDGKRLDDHVRGKLGGELRVDRRDATAHVDARGSFMLSSPDYPVLRRVEARLRSFGLPAPPTAGIEPLRCRVALGRHGLHVAEISARAACAAVEGDLHVGLDGALQGDLCVTLPRAYLAASPLLFVPASLVGGVRVPVSISGTLTRTRVHADLAGALGGLLRENAVTRVVSGAAQELWDTLGGTPPPSPPARPQRRERPPRRDAFDLLLEGDPRGAEIFDALVGCDDPRETLRLVEEIAAPRPRVRVG